MLKGGLVKNVISLYLVWVLVVDMGGIRVDNVRNYFFFRP